MRPMHSMARPDVVWFHEPLPEIGMGRAVMAAISSRVTMVMGTSAAVQPAASLICLAKRSGAGSLGFNGVATPVSAIADATVRGPVARVLPPLWEYFLKHEGHTGQDINGSKGHSRITRRSGRE